MCVSVWRVSAYRKEAYIVMPSAAVLVDRQAIIQGAWSASVSHV